MSADFSNDGDVRCSYHPDTMTRLRCGRCGKPICPKCGVRTPVGLRCPDCAGVRGLPTYATPANALTKAIGLGFVVALVIGVLWAQIPEWGFYLSLLLGFSIAEVMAWAVKGKRGSDLQIAGIVLVLVSLLISRVLLFNEFDVPLDQFSSLSEYGRQVLHVRLLPDGLIALMPLAIVWYRFR